MPSPPRRRSWVPALGRWHSVDAYQRVLRGLSLEDLPRVVAGDLDCETGMSVLDLGCGPGSLAQTLSQQGVTGLNYCGLDPDPRMLTKAQAHESADTRWILGLGQRLPFPDATFDRVTATLLLHHMTRSQKAEALSEARRVLRPHGLLFITDWTKPHGIGTLGFLLVRTLDGFAPTRDHAAGRLPDLIKDAGFTNLEVLRQRDLWLGTITHFRAMKSDAPVQ